MLTLKTPLRMEYSVLDSKVTTGSWQSGELTAISAKYAVVNTTSRLSALSNLKLRLDAQYMERLAGEFYCKMIEKHAGGATAYLVRFTSLPVGGKELIERVSP